MSTSTADIAVFSKDKRPRFSSEGSEEGEVRCIIASCSAGILDPGGLREHLNARKKAIESECCQQLFTGGRRSAGRASFRDSHDGLHFALLIFFKLDLAFFSASLRRLIRDRSVDLRAWALSM